jgi:hypothetical protein
MTGSAGTIDIKTKNVSEGNEQLITINNTHLQLKS